MLEGHRARRDPHARIRATRSTVGRSGSRPRGHEIGTHGKHLFIALRRRARDPLAPADDRALGRLRAPAGSWRARRARAWLVLARGGHEVVQFDGPVLELMTEGARALRSAAGGARTGRAGAERSTTTGYLARLRADDPTRGDRRRAARSAQRRGDREHLEGRGLLGGGDRPVAAGRRRVRRGGAGDHRAGRARGCCESAQTGRIGDQVPPPGRRVPPARGAAVPACGARIRARAARATTTAPPTGARVVSGVAAASLQRIRRRAEPALSAQLGTARRCSAPG